jgi:hypothetical protein
MKLTHLTPLSVEEHLTSTPPYVLMAWCLCRGMTLLSCSPSVSLTCHRTGLFALKFCMHFSSLLCVICPTYLILLDLMILILVDGKYILCFLLCNFLQSPFTSFLSVSLSLFPLPLSPGEYSHRHR